MENNTETLPKREFRVSKVHILLQHLRQAQLRNWIGVSQVKMGRKA